MEYFSVNLRQPFALDVAGLFTSLHLMDKKKCTTKLSRAARHQKRCYPFTPATRLYDLIKAEYHNKLAQWLEIIKDDLKGRGVPNWKTVRRLDFNCDTGTAAKLIARLMVMIEREKGLKCKMSVFFRYITSKEHSNIGVNDYYFNLLVNNIIKYWRSKGIIK